MFSTFKKCDMSFTDPMQQFLSGASGMTMACEDDLPRSERIAQFFNRDAEMCQRENSAGMGFAWTSNFVQKSHTATSADGASLRPISIDQMEVGVTHRGRAFYGRVVSKVMVMNAAAVLVEDEASNLTNLAVYGLSDPSVLREGRLVVEKEPFFKERADNTKGIRVDDQSNLVFDIPLPTTSQNMKYPTSSNSLPVPSPKTMEERLQDLVMSDNSIGISRLQQMLTKEGYAVSKQHVRALKRSILEHPIVE